MLEEQAHRLLEHRRHRHGDDHTEYAERVVTGHHRAQQECRVEVEGPHWESGKESVVEDLWSRLAGSLHLPVEPYSKRAAVYLIGGLGGPYDVEVKIRITRSKNVSGEARLIGTFSGVSIEGTCPSNAGEHTVRARIVNPPEELRVCRGRIAWRLDVEATPIGASVLRIGPSWIRTFAASMFLSSRRLLAARKPVRRGIKLSDCTIPSTMMVHCRALDRSPSGFGCLHERYATSSGSGAWQRTKK